MAVQLILKNSSVEDRRPTAAQLTTGELALNYNEEGAFLSCKDSAGNIQQVGGVKIAEAAPSAPVEQTLWFQPSTRELRVYNGSSWAAVSATILPDSIVNADINSAAGIAVSKLGFGSARQLLQTAASGVNVEFASNIDIPGTLDVTNAATFDNNVTIQGDLVVNGTTTEIDTTVLLVKDKNIEMGVVATPTDITADGGGITLKGATDKTINWVNSTDAWTFSEHVNIVSAKEYRIAGTKVLDATSLGSAVVSSSLTSVGTIGTGVWNGTAIAGTKISPDFGSQAVTTTGLISADGKVSFPLGTAALPSLYPGSDTNTGIYSPGADQVAISTNGTQRLAIDSSGNFLIGGTLPSSPNITLNGSNGSAEFAGKLVSASTVSGDPGTTLVTKDYVDSSGGGAVDSVNTQTGVVVLDADDISDSATTNKYVTQTELNSIASATQPGDNISTLTNDAGYITATETYWNRTGTTLSPVNAGDKVTSASTVSGDGGTTLATKDYVDSTAYAGIPQNAQTSAYTLVSSDNGKHISITTGGVTVPSGVFSVGDTISIYNNSAADQTITQGSSVTLRFAGTVNTGNRTLAQRGLVTVLCVGSNEFVISGGGLS